jgi:hypothetical protein
VCGDGQRFVDLLQLLLKSLEARCVGNQHTQPMHNLRGGLHSVAIVGSALLTSEQNCAKRVAAAGHGRADERASPELGEIGCGPAADGRLHVGNRERWYPAECAVASARHHRVARFVEQGVRGQAAKFRAA